MKTMNVVSGHGACGQSGTEQVPLSTLWVDNTKHVVSRGLMSISQENETLRCSPGAEHNQNQHHCRDEMDQVKFFNKSEKSGLNRMGPDERRDAYVAWSASRRSPGARPLKICQKCSVLGDLDHKCTMPEGAMSENLMKGEAWVGDAVLGLDIKMLLKEGNTVDDARYQSLVKGSYLSKYMKGLGGDYTGLSDHSVASRFECEYKGEFRKRFIVAHFGESGWIKLKEEWGKWIP